MKWALVVFIFLAFTFVCKGQADRVYWDIYQGKVDTQVLKYHLSKVTWYNSLYNFKDSNNRITAIYEYNKNGQLTRKIEGNNITKDSLYLDNIYQYSPDNILLESKQRVYPLNDPYGNLNFIRTSYQLDNDGTITLISKYTHNNEGKLIKVNRYHPDGKFCESRLLVDSTFLSKGERIDTENDDSFKLITDLYPFGFTSYKYSCRKNLLEKITCDTGKDGKIAYYQRVVYLYNIFNKIRKIISFDRHYNLISDYTMLYINDTIPYKDYKVQQSIYDTIPDEIRSFDKKGNITEDVYCNGGVQFRAVKYSYNQNGLESEEYITEKIAGKEYNRSCKIIYNNY